MEAKLGLPIGLWANPVLDLEVETEGVVELIIIVCWPGIGLCLRPN